MFSANSSQVSEDRLYVEDVFSTWLYTGNGSTQTITNGIDLAGKGGLIWTKGRNNPGYPLRNALIDTVRGLGSGGLSSTLLSTDGTEAQGVGNTASDIGAFLSNGYSFLGAPGGYQNNAGNSYVSWTFREAPKFFDVVTYSGTQVARTISHNLGVAPGLIIVKDLSIASQWFCYHRSLGATQVIQINTTDAAYTASFWNDTSPTDTVFSVSGNTFTNRSGSNYVAYLFAHDTTSDGIIQCGSYAGTNAAGNTVTLGWEPQWVLIKNTTNAQFWGIYDNMRGMPVGSNDALLVPNSSGAEQSYEAIQPTATGFQLMNGNQDTNASGDTYVYIAIRRGPMRTPTSGTSVYNDVLTTGTGSNSRIITGYGFNPDMLIFGPRSESGYNRRIWDRLRNTILYTDTTSSEASVGLYGISRADIQDGYVQGTSDASGYNQSGTTWANFGFRRAPSFLDEVCRPISSFSVNGNHNLGVAPEMIIGKRRDSNQNWFVYHTGLTGVNSQGKRNEQLLLNSDAAKTTAASDGYFVDGLTATSFETYWWPQSSGDAVLYFFASCPGVSKVGSYTGNGSSQTINCGFAAGARFVMIKRTDSTGDWYVWDSARGIVAGNDPRLSLNNTNAEVTTDDSVDTDSSGFVVNQLSATNINVSSATYIYLAVA